MFIRNENPEPETRVPFCTLRPSSAMTVWDLSGAPQTTLDPIAPHATISAQECPVVPFAGSRWPLCQRSVTVPSPCLVAVSHPLGPPSPRHLAGCCQTLSAGPCKSGCPPASVSKACLGHALSPVSALNCRCPKWLCGQGDHKHTQSPLMFTGVYPQPIHCQALTNALMSPYPSQVCSQHFATWARALPAPCDHPEMHPINIQLSCSPSPKFP